MNDSREEVTLKDKLIGWGLQPIVWLLMLIFKVHRLEAVDKIPLEAQIAEAFSLYGEPYDSQPDDRRPEATVHKFDVGIRRCAPFSRRLFATRSERRLRSAA